MSKDSVLNGRWLFRLALILGLVSNATALQISRLSNTNLWVDFTLTPPMQCNYVAYQITNNDGVAYSNLWVTIGSFSGSVVSLGGSDPGKYNLGALPVNGAKPVFFYLAATNTTTVAQTHTISIYQGYPSVGTVLRSSNFSMTVSSLRTTGQNKQTAASYAPATPVLGSVVVLTVDGSTGPLKTGDLMIFTPASVTNWSAYAFQIVSTSITVTNGSSTYLFTNILSFGQPGSQGSVSYHAQYSLRAVAVTPGSTPTSPDGAFATGNNSTLEHSIVNAGVVLPAILAPTNATLLAKSANLTQLYTNQTVAYSLSFTNGSTSDLSLDRIVDTLPTNFSIVSGSSSFGGSPLGDPIASGQTLTWSDGYTVPASTSRSLTFSAVATVAGRTTNSAVGFTSGTQIDATLTTTDNVPATASVRVLSAPTAVNDSATTLENTLLTVSAPGVLSNDIEPNGFTLSVVTNTQPAHGTVTVTANGSYTYMPATNFNGSDSFTYTITNGNAGSATATVNLTVLAVNHPPTLNAIGNLTIFEGGGLQTVSLSGISPGPANESGQTLTLTATSSATSIIPNPTPNYTNGNSTGSLTFTPVSNALGTATISVVLHDNGGTANGGVDTITNTFTVTVLALTNIWATNGVLTVTVHDALGQPGAGYSQTNYIGFLDVQASTNAPFTIQLVSSAGGIGGLATNFNNNSNFTWTIATTTRGVLEFDPTKFIVDTSGFTNDLAGGTFSVTTNGSNVSLVFNPNHPPVALPVLLGRAWGTSMRIPLPSVLTNFTSDPDGDPTAFSGFGSSTNGSSISTNAIFLLFVPSNNFPESFTYTVHDVRTYRPGDTIRTATNWVTIAVTNAVSSVTSLVSSGGSVTVQFAGVPGYAYDVQRASSLGGPWTVILTTNAPPHGLWIYTDPSPPQPTAFYRLQQH